MYNLWISNFPSSSPMRIKAFAMHFYCIMNKVHDIIIHFHFAMHCFESIDSQRIVKSLIYTLCSVYKKGFGLYTKRAYRKGFDLFINSAFISIKCFHLCQAFSRHLQCTFNVCGWPHLQHHEKKLIKNLKNKLKNKEKRSIFELFLETCL